MDNSVDLQTALENYKNIYFASRNFGNNTRREYHTDILQLIDFLASKGITEPLRVTLNDLNGYLAYLDTQNLAGASRSRKTSTIKSFFSYMEEIGYISFDISKRLIPPKKATIPPRVLSEGEYKRLQLAVANEPRDAAIIELLLQTGVRLSELAGLTINDIELPNKISQDEGDIGSITVRGKGRKTRVLTLNYKVCKTIKNWLRIRPDYGIPALFLSKFRTPITAIGFQWIVKKYLDEAGITGAHVHTLRHTFGTHMVKKGTNLRVVQEMLGHNDLRTTSIYVSLARELMDKQVQANAL